MKKSILMSLVFLISYLIFQSAYAYDNEEQRQRNYYQSINENNHEQESTELKTRQPRSDNWPDTHPATAVSSKFSWFSDDFNIYLWRDEDSTTWVEIEPINSEPFICSATFDIFQDGSMRQQDNGYGVAQIEDKNGASVCKDVSEKTVFQLTLRYGTEDLADLAQPFDLYYLKGENYQGTVSLGKEVVNQRSNYNIATRELFIPVLNIEDISLEATLIFDNHDKFFLSNTKSSALSSDEPATYHPLSRVASIPYVEAPGLNKAFAIDLNLLTANPVVLGLSSLQEVNLIRDNMEFSVSHKSAVPGTFITIEDSSIKRGKALKVSFKDASGNKTELVSLLTKNGSAKIPVPPLMNTSTGISESGEVIVSLANGHQTTLKIEALPELENMETGYVIKTYLQHVLDNYDQALESLANREDNIGYEPEDLITLIQSQRHRVKVSLDELNTSGDFHINSLALGQITPSANSLKTIDKLLYATLKGIIDEINQASTLPRLSREEKIVLQNGLLQIRSNASNLDSLVYGGPVFKKVQRQVRAGISGLIGSMRWGIGKVGGGGPMTDLGLEVAEGISRIVIDGMVSDVVNAIAHDKYSVASRQFGDDTINATRDVIKDTVIARLPVDTDILLAIYNGDLEQMGKIFRRFCRNNIPTVLVKFCAAAEKEAKKRVYPSVNHVIPLPRKLNSDGIVDLRFSISGFQPIGEYAKKPFVRIDWGDGAVDAFESRYAYTVKKHKYTLDSYQDKEYTIKVTASGVEAPFNSHFHENSTTVLVRSAIDVLSAEFTQEAPASLIIGEVGTWTVQVTGGKPPYDTKMEWGDGKVQGKSSTEQTSFTGTHSYSQENMYTISFTVTDANGITKSVETFQSVYAAQELPEMTVTATDATANEEGDTGKFTLTRSGDLSEALTVSFKLSGTATPKDDYAAFVSPTTFSAGVRNKIGTVTPVADDIIEGNETVIMTFVESPDYTIGTAGSATVVIVEVVDCDAGHLNVCVIENDCVNAGGVWSNDSCIAVEDLIGRPNQSVCPGSIEVNSGVFGPNINTRSFDSFDDLAALGYIGRCIYKDTSAAIWVYYSPGTDFSAPKGACGQENGPTRGNGGFLNSTERTVSVIGSGSGEVIMDYWNIMENVLSKAIAQQAGKKCAP